MKKEIATILALLEGKTVDGLKMGDAGLSREWLLDHLEGLMAIANAK